MGFLILVIFIAVVGLVITFAGPKFAPDTTKTVRVPDERGYTTRTEEQPVSRAKDRRWVRRAGYSVIGVAVLVILLGSYTQVPAQNVGVVVEFGKPTRAISNGLHVIPPWAHVVTFDATKRTVSIEIPVRLKNAPTANIRETIQWRIAPDLHNVPQLYKDWKSFENIQTNVVEKETAAVLNEKFEQFDPLAAIKGEANAVSITKLTQDAVGAVQALLPSGTQLLSLTTTFIQYPDQVQQQIDKLLASVANTRAAEQQELTAQALARAANTLANAPLTPAVLYQQCLSMVERVTTSGQQLPAGFSCGTPPATVVAVGGAK